MNTKDLNTGDFARYGKCKVRISSAKLRGIAAPHYRFSCVEKNHDHLQGWGNLISHRLLADGVRELC